MRADQTEHSHIIMRTPSLLLGTVQSFLVFKLVKTDICKQESLVCTLERAGRLLRMRQEGWDSCAAVKGTG